MKFCCRHQRAKLQYSAGPRAKPSYRCPACISEKNRAYRESHKHKVTHD